VLNVMLSYARDDGAEAAARLHKRLERVGYTVSQDVADLRAGESWQQQLGRVLKSVDVVLVLLTPKAVASKMVEWEWTTTLFALEKPVIPVVILPCDIPHELARLQYRDLSQPDRQDDEYDALLSDLNALQESIQTAKSPATKYKIVDGERVVIGDRALGIFGWTPAEAAEIKAQKMRHLAQLETQIDAEQDTATYDIRGVKVAVVGDDPIGIFETEAVDKATLIDEIRSMFEDSERRLMAQFIARMDNLEVHTLAEVRDVMTVIKTDRIPEQEIRDVVTDLRTQLEHLLSSQKSLYEDISLAEQTKDAAELISEPGADVRHRLLVTVPIVPLLLTYEGEIEFNVRTNLEAIWKKMSGWRSVKDSS
jgi:hypothetical protein